MPPVEDDFTILVCDCGKRLKAPGARPGRVGQCPACGGILRAPGDLSKGADNARNDQFERKTASRQADGDSDDDRAARPASTRQKRPKNDAPIAYGGPAPLEDSVPRESVNPTRIGLDARKRDPAGPIGREGLVRAPKRPEESVSQSLLYPLWDGNGIAMLLFLPPTLWLTSMLSIGLIPSYVIGADLVTRMGAISLIFPMSILLAFTLGYVGTFLSEVVTTSAFGEVYHPRVPPWMLGPTLGSLMRGLCALVAGMMVSGPMLIAYGITRDSFGPMDWLIAALLVVPGVAYAQVALVAILLYGSVLAANPFTVLGALWRAGGDSLRIALFMSISTGVTVAATVGLFWLPRFGMLAVLIGVWVFWLGVLYEVMVLCRVLGLFYRRHSEQIGWFPDRPRWGVGRD